jgi:endonuclease YncB( thermonuclease family)
MYGYDSPEMKPLKSIEFRDLHIKAANISKNMLIKLTLNKIFWVKFKNEDKYGRLLGELYEIVDNSVFIDQKNINNYMIENGYGKKYFGEKKQEFTIDELNNIINMSRNHKNQ